jgi:hypothetical protein
MAVGFRKMDADKKSDLLRACLTSCGGNSAGSDELADTS